MSDVLIYLIIGIVIGLFLSPIAIYLVGAQIMGRSMQKKMGPCANYQLVFVRRPVRLTKPSSESIHFVDDGKAAGILIKSWGDGHTMFHRPEHFLRWIVEGSY